jgi:AP-3 complex subunit delta-1
MFELSLLDLIKGIRAHPESEDAFIAGALKEIKQELKSSNGDIKAQALEKLIYVTFSLSFFFFF